MACGTHTLPRTTAAPVASDFIHSSCSPRVVWVSSSSKGPGCCWMQSAPAHTLMESCDPSPPVAFLFSVVRAARLAFGVRLDRQGRAGAAAVDLSARAWVRPGHWLARAKDRKQVASLRPRQGGVLRGPCLGVERPPGWKPGWMGDTLLSPELGRAETHAECCVWGCCLGQGDQTSRHHLPP